MAPGPGVPAAHDPCIVADGTGGLVGRPLAVLAVAAAVPYLVWRATATGDGAAPVLFWSLWVVEVALWCRFLIGAWAMWRPTTPTALRGTRPDGPTDVVVTVADEPLAWVQASLVACRVLRHRGRVLVVDAADRPSVAALAARLGAHYTARADGVAASGPPAGRAEAVAAGLARTTSPTVLVLRAGDVPLPDAVDVLTVELRDASGPGPVAMALGGVRHWHRAAVWTHEGADDDGVDHIRRSCASRRGCSLWDGGPALVRRDLLATVLGPLPASPAPELRASVALRQAGHRVRRSDRTCAESPGPVDLVDALAQREAASIGLLHLLLTRQHPLLGRRIPWRLRVTLLDELASVVGSLLLPVVVAVLAAVAVTGRPAVDAPLTELVLRGGPPLLLAGGAAVALTRGRHHLTAGWLRALRRVGPDLRALARVATGRAGTAGVAGRPRLDGPGAGSVVQLAAVAVLLLALLGAVAARLADIAFDLGLLPGLAGVDLAVVALVGTPLAAGMGHVLGLVARHRELRWDPRRACDLPAGVDGRPAVVLDLTPAGAGIRTTMPVPVGAGTRITIALPDTAGVARSVTLPAEVRHCEGGPGGAFLGVRFLPGPVEAEDLLLEHCAVTVPYADLRGAERIPVDPPAALPAGPPPVPAPGAGPRLRAT